MATLFQPYLAKQVAYKVPVAKTKQNPGASIVLKRLNLSNLKKTDQFSEHKLSTGEPNQFNRPYFLAEFCSG